MKTTYEVKENLRKKKKKKGKRTAFRACLMPFADLQADTPKPARAIPEAQQLTSHARHMVQACTKILQTKSLRETEQAGISLPVHCTTQDCPATGTHQTEFTRLSDSLLSQSRARSEANTTQGKPKHAHREPVSTADTQN